MKAWRMAACCVAGVVAVAVAQAPAGDGRTPQAGGTVIGGGPVARDAAEQRILDVLDDMDKNQRVGSMSVAVDDGRLLRVLVESLNARTVVELGTSIGYSAIWMCLGLRATGGHLTTYEIDAGRAEWARANFKRAGVEDLVTLVEGNAHETIKTFKGSVDLVFLDADKKGYILYLEALLPLLRRGGLIVAHNMCPRLADPAYVRAVTTHPELETVFINRPTDGIGLTLKKR